MTKDQASWDGEPETGDLSLLKNFTTPDPIAMLNRRKIIASAYRFALLIWSVLVAFTLMATIVTGDLSFWILGYMVTVPYLVVCYKYRRQTAAVQEAVDYCDFDGCDL